ncbi:MAG: double-strand break repair helicase AddA [Pseudomonadota bacterium]
MARAFAPTPPNDATRAQIAAATPDRSSWVSANAGSGKTRVLTDRVARLLLQQVEPQRILCLTYTKAAAAEMQNRLFERLGAWAMLDDARLRAALVELGEAQAAERADLGPARRLFARALEAPGGLKIQTIHSFCDQILRRFPVEAGVSPQFEVLEDRQAEQVRRQCLEDLAEDEADGVLSALAAEVDSAGLQGLIAAVLSQAEAFAAPFDEGGLRAALGHPGGYDPPGALAELRAAQEAPGWRALAQACLANATAAQQRRGAALAAALSGEGEAARVLEALLPNYLTRDGHANTRLLNKALRQAVPDADGLVAALTPRLERVEDARRAERLVTRSRVLHAFAQRFLARYAQRKAQIGRLDYDDLIARVRALLCDGAAAAWVLYKLDGGVEHILVDEAQDTSPTQWQVIQALTDEFFAGDGAQTRARTVFVVGDEKQSIYSFQGAEPEAFGTMRARFKAALEPLEAPLQDCALLYSFRSAAPVLEAVDAVFSTPDLMAVAEPSQHVAFKTNLPGSVHVWPFSEATPAEKAAPWHELVDQGWSDRVQERLAREIAATVTDWLHTGQSLPGQSRPIRAGDVMILVQKRGPVFNAVLRALEEAGVPVAGTDRLKLTEELAVKDILSLLRFLATPTDDLALAEVLRSPLGGLSEDALFALAHGRPKLKDSARLVPLWRRLEEAKDTHKQVVSMLKDLRNSADFLRPFELVARALTRHGGREALTGRLGVEAEDAIDALLESALAYEQVEAPSLTGFLEWFAAQEVEVKREFAKDLDQVRVMTVHGAKGLEAPIVILPDTAKQSLKNTQPLGQWGPHPLWPGPANTHPVAWQAEHATAREAQAAEKWRLLYVAMTRAEQVLIVCGAGKEAERGEGSWYHAVSQGLERLETVEEPDGTLRYGVALGGEAVSTVDEIAPECAPLPDWALTEVEAPPRETVLAPSQLDGAHSLAGSLAEDTAEDLRARGTQIHLLLEHLPRHDPAQYRQVARGLLADISPDDALLDDLLGEVSPLLGRADLGTLFGPEALAEVAISAVLPELNGARIEGTIDRLVVQGTKVEVVDFKSNRVVPDSADQTPEAILRQLGAYGAALRLVYPNHDIALSVLWTRTGRLMPIPHDLVTQALHRAAKEKAPRD